MITNSHSAVFQKQLEVRDYKLLFGAQYAIPFANNRITLGLTYSPGKTLLGHMRQIRYDNVQDARPEVTDEMKLRGNYSLPETWGAGINYQLGRRWMVEVDYTYQPWSKAKFTLFEGESTMQSYSDRTKIAAGLQ